MSSKGKSSNKEGGEESSLMLQAMQQQFEHMNVVFNARRQGRRVRVDDSNDYNEDEFEHEEDQASLNHEGKFAPREKGVVEVSEELQDGKMRLIET
ncbi:hypothetical protein CK203_061322 [Vitis vinifera]|uniref:Uncharacterized protein n=1 Tax=Vitis vinifera TaxID=29760 RepID=A0A438GHP6_VITVI|nr:hypothetical protein CK203_061322 [Vitis vinifera]